MARPLRIEYPGAVYHITSRGNAREAIALADDDRDDFFHVLGTVVERHSWRCYAYCLMTNHYHLLIETPTANISRGTRQNERPVQPDALDQQMPLAGGSVRRP